jgi:hypothetical protein
MALKTLRHFVLPELPYYPSTLLSMISAALLKNRRCHRFCWETQTVIFVSDDRGKKICRNAPDETVQ